MQIIGHLKHHDSHCLVLWVQLQMGYDRADTGLTVQLREIDL